LVVFISNFPFTAFNEFNQSAKTKTMENIIGKALTNSYHKRLAYLEGKEIISLVDYAKKYFMVLVLMEKLMTQ
jgi:hypothetical protein